MSFKSLFWVRIGGAGFALLLAAAYLAGYIVFALTGFGLIGLIGGTIGYRINGGNLPATCDLCGQKGLFRAEYGHGFGNARLILDCPECGRVVNRAGGGVGVAREKTSGPSCHVKL
jgi:hypothetical protein